MLEYNFDNKQRKVGFEIEYAGLSLKLAAQKIQNFFGGNINEKNKALITVENTKYGKFNLELDAIPLQKIEHKNKILEKSDEFGDKVQYRLGKTISNIGAKIVPFEIVCPPIPTNEISHIDALCNDLKQHGAKGTQESFHYAFGLHINAELISLSSNYLLRNIQSYLLLAPWLKEIHNTDITRRIAGFIDQFPQSYLNLTLNTNYKPKIEDLIRDYHSHNPSRNRALDMLPAFAYLKHDFVRELYGDKEKINARPTFHYRLPNCEISNNDWSLTKEWQRWQIIEKIANDETLFLQLLTKWQEFQKKLLPLETTWIKVVDNFVEKKI